MGHRYSGNGAERAALLPVADHRFANRLELGNFVWILVDKRPDVVSTPRLSYQHIGRRDTRLLKQCVEHSRHAAHCRSLRVRFRHSIAANTLMQSNASAVLRIDQRVALWISALRLSFCAPVLISAMKTSEHALYEARSKAGHVADK